jgi:Flp pilus assembly protein TadB
MITGLCVPFATVKFVKFRREQIMKRVEHEFVEIMQVVLTSVSSGVPIDRAFVELRETMTEAVWENKEYRLILREVDSINRKVEMNYSFFSLLDDFARRSGSRDIVNLSKAIMVSGTEGGNMAYIIRNALANMRIKANTDKEIRQILALPKYNHRIITLMPFFLKIMLHFISKGYIEGLYNSVFGETIVLLVVVTVFFAWLLGDRICDIKV